MNSVESLARHEHLIKTNSKSSVVLNQSIYGVDNNIDLSKLGLIFLLCKATGVYLAVNLGNYIHILDICYTFTESNA